MSSTVADLIDLAIQSERKAETLYLKLAEKFAHHPEVAKFWETYALEEEGHARWLENLQKRVGEEKLNEATDLEMLRQAKHSASASLEQILANIHNLDDAYELVNELEHAETNAVFEFLVGHFSEDQLTQTFLRSQLRDHIGRLLMEFPAQYRMPTIRRSVEALED